MSSHVSSGSSFQLLFYDFFPLGQEYDLAFYAS